MRYAIETMDKTFKVEDAHEIKKKVSLMSVKNLLKRDGFSWGMNSDFHVVSQPNVEIMRS